MAKKKKSNYNFDVVEVTEEERLEYQERIKDLALSHANRRMTPIYVYFYPANGVIPESYQLCYKLHKQFNQERLIFTIEPDISLDNSEI